MVDKLCKDLQVERVSKSWTILLNTICILHLVKAGMLKAHSHTKG